MNIGKRISSLTVTIAALTIFGAGCGGASSHKEQTVQGDPQGTISFEEKDSQKGIMRGTYDHDGYQIHFEVARGESNPTIEVQGGGPKNAIDVRLCDEVGFCFAQQAGGHGFADPSWGQTPEEQERLAPDDARAKKNMDAAGALNHDLLLMSRDKDFEGLQEEYDALENLTRMSGPWRPTSDSDERTPQVGVLSFQALTSGTYTHWFEMWWAPLNQAPIFEHSSMSFWVKSSSGQTVFTFNTCNHGACGGAAGLNQGCVRSFPNRPLQLPVTAKCDVPATTGATHTGDGCCQSPYGLAPSQHVCNDDTRLQKDFMVAGGGISVAYCADLPIAGVTPNCY